MQKIKTFSQQLYHRSSYLLVKNEFKTALKFLTQIVQSRI